MALRCLLVDDSVDFLASASSLLTVQGLVVVGGATTGSEALRVAAETQPDVALVDVELGPEDGVALAVRLAEEGLAGHVVLISMRDRAEVGELTSTPIAGFIPKASLRAEAVTSLVAGAASGRARTVSSPSGHSLDRSGQLAALRRLAGLVARGADTQTIIERLAHETADVIGIDAVGVYRYDAGDRTITKLYATHGDRAAALDGATWSIELSPSLVEMVDTATPVRDDTWLTADNVIAQRHRAQGYGESIAAPIIVDGTVWGLVSAFGRVEEILHPNVEHDLGDFAALVATTVANAKARAMAESQGALRRVATLAAHGNEPRTVFTAVAHEASALLRVDAVSLIRYDAASGMLTKIYGTHGNRSPVLDGTTWPVTDSPEADLVVRTGKPSRVDDWSGIPGSIADWHRAGGFGGSIAAPIMVAGALWGILAAYGEDDQILPPHCELDLADYTNLMASAIANADARDELRGLASRHGEALRRVAALVARRASSAEVFDAVAAEARRALSVKRVELCRARPDGTVTFLGLTSRSAGPDGCPVAERIARLVVASGGTVRLDDLATEDGIASAVGAPIRVDGKAWGAIAVLGEVRLDDDIENRLADFTYLVAGSVSNVRARDELLASRARIVTAGDETRRRIERNLHDGVQQRLVSLGMELRATRAGLPLPPGADEALRKVIRGLEEAQEEIRIFSQGLHPALLSRAGLGPALRGLVRRAPVPTDLRVRTGRRFAEPVESAVYYVVSEALTNIGKHADASRVSVDVEADDVTIRAIVADDGVGGASLERGTGIIGLVDRVEAAGGDLTLTSPVGHGTTISIEIPVVGNHR